MFQEMRNQVAEAAIDADNSGLCKHGTGNFSAIDRKHGLIAISPSGIDRVGLKWEDIPVIDMEGRIAEAGRGKPSSEFLMHLAAYESRTDIDSIIHTHSHYATAFAVLGEKIKPVSFEAYFYGVNTEVAGFARPGTAELAALIRKPLVSADVCLLKNHGVLVVGCGIMETLLKAKYLENVAKVYYLSRTVNGGVVDGIPMEEFIKYGAEDKKRKNI
jgi:L-fuculose-phosphate aldolase